MSIFDLMTSVELAAYWQIMSQHDEPFMGEELFPAQKKTGLSLKWIKGSKGLPVTLMTSAFDATAVPRPRIGFDKLSAEMPYFKESLYIDEELRQELNMVLETGNQAYIDSVLNRVFDDEVQLLRGAAATREMMRMMALTTGVVSMAANGQTFTFDYGVTNKSTVLTSWSNLANADPMKDIEDAIEALKDKTGASITRALCNQKTWKYLKNNEKIKKNILVMSNGAGNISDTRLREYLFDELGIFVAVNNKRYAKTIGGASTKYVPDDTFVLFPEGTLGNTWFGTTPQESDLMTGSAANVSIVDTGVAITTVKKTDPVNVEAIVSMICLPSFEAADDIYILDVSA